MWNKWLMNEVNESKYTLHRPWRIFYFYCSLSIVPHIADHVPLRLLPQRGRGRWRHDATAVAKKRRKVTTHSGVDGRTAPPSTFPVGRQNNQLPIHRRVGAVQGLRAGVQTNPPPCDKPPSCEVNYFCFTANIVIEDYRSTVHDVFLYT